MQRWQIVNAGENLFRPLLMRVITEGVGTFDPEGVGDMIQTLAARTNLKILDLVQCLR